MPDWGSIPQLVILTSEINLKFFSNPRGAKPTCNTHLTPMKYRTEIIVWSNVNVLYTIPWVHSTTFDPELRNEFKNFPIWGAFHNFWSWTQKWKIYIHTFYEVSCSIKHITAISNLHLQ